MRLLQMYLPWGDESELKHADGSFMSTFYEVKDEIDEVIKHYKPYDEITPEDLENAYSIFSDEEDNVSDDEIDDDLAFFNTDVGCK